MNESDIAFLYGIGVALEKKMNWRFKSNLLSKQILKDVRIWAHLTDFNMTEFIHKTMPVFAVWTCVLNDIDCRNSWTIVPTHRGLCLQLDFHDAVKRASNIADEYTVGYHSSINILRLRYIFGTHDTLIYSTKTFV